MRYDVQIPQGNMDDEKAEIVSEGKNQYVILSVDGQKVSLPFQVIDILYHEAEIVRYFSRLEEANEEKNAALREETSRRLKEKNALHITGATLLSIEEAREMDEDILKADQDWWLGSPGYRDDVAACVNSDDGSVIYFGHDVTYSFGVRPALKITNLESSIYQIGDTLSFGDHSFTIISEKYALCDEIIEKRPFCNDHKKGNDYETSDIKVFVDNWFDRTKELEAERARENNLNKAKQVWDELTDVPMDPETECIESDWKQFPTGTHREEIWHWIEDTYNVSVAEDLMLYGYCEARDEEEREI